MSKQRFISLLRDFFRLQDEVVEVFPTLVIQVKLLQHDSLKQIVDLPLILPKVLLSVELLTVGKRVVLNDGSGYLIGQVQQRFDLANPELFLVEHDDARPVQTELVK